MKYPESKNLKKNNYKIFLFHGVIKKNSYEIRNYTNKHLVEKIFLNHLKNIKKNFNILSLKEIIFKIENNQDLPSNTCAVTFDDGFENNYSIAAPILEDLNVPTTFFFSSDFLCSTIVITPPFFSTHSFAETDDAETSILILFFNSPLANSFIFSLSFLIIPNFNRIGAFITLLGSIFLSKINFSIFSKLTSEYGILKIFLKPLFGSRL